MLIAAILLVVGGLDFALAIYGFHKYGGSGIVYYNFIVGFICIGYALYMLIS